MEPTHRNTVSNPVTTSDRALEDYGQAWRCQRQAEKELAAAEKRAVAAAADRQEKWRAVKDALVNNRLPCGIHRLHQGGGPYAEGVLLDLHHDYPDLLLMYR